MRQFDLFYGKLKEDREHSRFNAVSMDKGKYLRLINKVKSVKEKTRKEGNEYKFLKRYDVLEVNGINRLISPVKEPGAIKYFVYDEELFDVLNDAHATTGHGGRDRMMKQLRSRYQNVTYRDVQTFLNLCEPCQQKQKCKHKNAFVKPMSLEEFNSRCQVDLIDFRSHPDGDYKFILHYQDLSTKFVILKPLESKTADEVCRNIIEIFTLFGASSVLQSDNGREYVDKIMDSLKNFWPNLKIIHDKEREGESQDVENMLVTWMQANSTSNWSQGLKFVQLAKNSSFHADIKRTPYEAMFGRLPSQGLPRPNIPRETFQLVKSEEDLENTTEDIRTFENDDYLQSTAVPSTRIGSYQEDSMTTDSDTSMKELESIKEEPFDSFSIQAERTKKNSDYDSSRDDKGATDRIPEVDPESGDAQSALDTVLEVQDRFCRLKQPLDKTVSRRTVAPARSLFKCSCTLKCESLKCKCKRNGASCTSKCHNSSSCRNK